VELGIIEERSSPKIFAKMSQKFVADGDTESAPETPRSPDTLDSISALARFEFELGKGNDGTKVLMVEWEDYSETRGAEGLWQVSWSGKTTVLPADERPADNIRRFYFLLPPGTKIPPHVTLTYQLPSKPASSVKRPQHLMINPLPAIFPPELGVSARTSGRKGVLHTIWAKKRLQALDKEIRQEQDFNLEGIALEMAISEKDWIENNFGIAPKVPALDMSSLPKYAGGPLSPGLASPKSPGGRKLSEKLKGLTLGTSEKDLTQRTEGRAFSSNVKSSFVLILDLGVNTPSHDVHPLSPESSDVAFSSFQSFRQTPSSGSNPAAKKKVTSQAPPEHIKRQQSNTSMPSINFMSSVQEKDEGDELFAKALSPRTPDVARSPFSFSSQETMPYLNPKRDK
jgi:hypothetical protein